MKSPGLGKGLAALIPHRGRREASPVADAEVPSASEGTHTHRVIHIPLEQIDRNPEQLRVEFSETELEDLAQSIRTHGIIQPLVVTRDGGRYTLVAGERRFKAAKQAGLRQVPCLIHAEVTPRERLELALIENVQRADLNPLEQAFAYKRLHGEFGLSHEDIARAVGKERPSVSNTIRLLDLPEEIQASLRAGEITFGHARGLLAVKNPEKQREMFEKIRRGELTTRGLERSTRNVQVHSHTRSTQKDPQLALYEQELTRALGARARIKNIGDGGNIEIEYYSDEELSGLVERLTR